MESKRRSPRGGRIESVWVLRVAVAAQHQAENSTQDDSGNQYVTTKQIDGQTGKIISVKLDESGKNMKVKIIVILVSKVVTATSALCIYAASNYSVTTLTSYKPPCICVMNPNARSRLPNDLHLNESWDLSSSPCTRSPTSSSSCIPSPHPETRSAHTDDGQSG